MNKSCRHCGKEIEITVGGRRRDFCPGDDCYRAYRLEYKRRKEQERRDSRVDNLGNGNGHETKRLSVKEKYASKYCPNYSTAEREGFCITFSDPIRAFKFDCDRCPIASMLLNKS